MTEHCDWCPFSACIGCIHQGGDTPTQQGEKPGLTCENGAEVKRSPGAVLGRSGSTGDLTTTTIKESSDGCF